MRNMSYCMFENTFKALEQVKEEGNWDSSELSKSERYYRKQLIELCRELAEAEFDIDIEEDE